MESHYETILKMLKDSDIGHTLDSDANERGAALYINFQPEVDKNVWGTRGAIATLCFDATTGKLFSIDASYW